MYKPKKQQLIRMIQILNATKNGLLISDIAGMLRINARTVKRYITDIRYTHPVVDIREAANKHSRFKLLET